MPQYKMTVLVEYVVESTHIQNVIHDFVPKELWDAHSLQVLKIELEGKQ
jgi:hypothetical protein